MEGHMTKAGAVGIGWIVLGWLSLGTAGAQNLERGQSLHENHCRMCHDSIAYKRGEKIAKNYDEVRAQVVRWETNTGLHWSPEDVDNVAAYLASRYYKYPLPGETK
jgi:mono/diheme cytochrome c family protein